MKTVDYAKEYMKISQQKLQALVEEAKKRLPNEILNQQELLSITEEEKHRFDTFYVEFEDKFRGSREDIKERVSVYLPYIEKLPFEKDEMSFLDVGCGRGEWLEVLRENNYKNLKGIDINRIMVAKSKALGLDVIESDVIEYLQNQKDESLHVITGFHIIEHLPFEVLMKLFEESYRVLKKGGMVIFETPNPENILVGACNFYTDPTHLNPLVPDTIEFVCQKSSFKNTEILRLHARRNLSKIKDENIEELVWMANKEQDYSIIGYKL